MKPDKPITAEEAVQYLEADNSLIRFDPNTGEEKSLEQIRNESDLNYHIYQANQFAVETITKFCIPKKPSVTPPDLAPYCPGCGVQLDRSNMPLKCPICGELIDWSDDV